MIISLKLIIIALFCIYHILKKNISYLEVQVASLVVIIHDCDV